MTTVDSSPGRDVAAPGAGAGTPGDLALQLTATELGKLRPQGWVLVNRVTLTRPDIDHVLIGPGGVIAIESEWATREWTSGCTELDSAARRARRNALRLTLWHDLRPAEVGAVASAVVLWGPGGHALKAPFDISGTTIVPGHCVARWRTLLADDHLTDSQVQSTWRALSARCRGQVAG